MGYTKWFRMNWENHIVNLTPLDALFLLGDMMMVIKKDGKTRGGHLVGNMTLGEKGYN